MLSRQEKRLNRITKILQLSNPATVNKLASVLEVSHMTIRRDLEILEGRDLVEIFHGGVVLKNGVDARHPYSLSDATKQMHSEKDRIAAKAAGLVNNGDTILMDTGSTLEFLSKSLPEELDATIICFTINTLVNISKLQNARIIFPGGYFHQNTLMFESKEGIKLINSHPADKAFISASGVSLEMGVSCSNEYEYKTKLAIMKSAGKKILLADSSKYGRVKSTYFGELGDFDMIICDKGIPPEYKEFCRDNGIELILV